MKTHEHMTYASVTAPPSSSLFATPDKPHNNPERKFNIVIYGVNECPEGSSGLARISMDTKESTAIIQKVNAAIPSNSVRDCVRLGRYDKKKHRPILVKLTRTYEVTSILDSISPRGTGTYC